MNPGSFLILLVALLAVGGVYYKYGTVNSSDDDENSDTVSNPSNDDNSGVERPPIQHMASSKNHGDLLTDAADKLQGKQVIPSAVATLYYDERSMCSAYFLRKHGDTRQEFEGSILVTLATAVLKKYDTQNQKATYRDMAGYKLVLTGGRRLTNGDFIDSVKFHPKFDEKTSRYDVALLKLKSPITVHYVKEPALYEMYKDWIDTNAKNDGSWIQPWADSEIEGPEF